MITTKKQFKKMSKIARPKIDKIKARASLAKTLCRRDGYEESPLAAIQKVQFYRKQKIFLEKQADIFEEKSKSLNTQIKGLEKRIISQKELALKIVQNLGKDKAEVEGVIKKAVKSKKTFGNQTKKFFKLRY